MIHIADPCEHKTMGEFAKACLPSFKAADAVIRELVAKGDPRQYANLRELYEACRVDGWHRDTE